MSEIRVIENPTYWSVKSPATGVIVIPRDGRWTFDGNYERPTFGPSINETWQAPDGPLQRNHCFIRNGYIEYLSDCTHSMAGQTVEAPVYTEANLEIARRNGGRWGDDEALRLV